MNGSALLVLMAACYAAGILGSPLVRRWPLVALLVGHAGALAGALVGVVLALVVLAAGPAAPETVSLPQLFPFARMSFAVDGLSAFFLLVVSLGAIAASIYGPAYLRAHGGEHGGPAPGVHAPAFAAFVGSMAFLCCSNDALSFLLLWEGMTLASYVLVVSADPRSGEHAHAGLIYVVMAHIGTAPLIFVFLALAERAGSFDFPALREAARGLAEPSRSVFFFLALFGFAMKAGVVPLHVWLPHAHPAAPSHVSALMSGVMLKVAIYGLLRMAFDVLRPAASPLPASWGYVVLVLGAVSAVIGVLYALQQHDLKRLLAFHSVENVGIILIGAGMAMLLSSRHGAKDTIATLALAAALLHTINHAAFKGLLFLGAGSVLCRTHVRNLEELGGLARRMPWTAWLFLLGAVAISGLPPLNGFVSEWMTFQALVLGAARTSGAAGLLAAIVASMLALTGALAAACFVKAFGVTFLGRPRSAHAEHATEVPAPMIAGMLVLAGACVLLGVLPGFALRIVDRPIAELLGGARATAVLTPVGPLVLSSGGAEGLDATTISVTGAALAFALLACGAAVVARWTRGAPERLAPTWTCGMTPVSRFDYTATAFAKPLRLIFAALYRPRRSVVREASSSAYVPRRIEYRGEVVDVTETVLYARLRHLVTRTARAIRGRSTGRIHGYIAFTLGTLVLALLVFGRR